jgi:hypothetical protein
MQSIDDLADVITGLDPSEQQVLLDRVAQLNFQKRGEVSRTISSPESIELAT